MKKALAILVLFSIVLHCASRLGFISYLFSQRHAIAFEIGLIDEIPIAMCDSNYAGSQAPLVIQDHQDGDQQLPVQIHRAQEINLFIDVVIPYDTSHPGIKVTAFTPHYLQVYPSPDLAIFHPPCAA